MYINCPSTYVGKVSISSFVPNTLFDSQTSCRHDVTQTGNRNASEPYLQNLYRSQVFLSSPPFVFPFKSVSPTWTLPLRQNSFSVLRYPLRPLIFRKATPGVLLPFRRFRENTPALGANICPADKLLKLQRRRRFRRLRTLGGL